MSTAAEDCQTLPAILQRQAELTPDATALFWRNEAISYRELQTRVHALASALTTTGAPGDRVAVLSFNSPQFVELIYAIPAAGRILVPLNARLAPAEWVDQLARTDCKQVFAEPQLLARLKDQEGFSGDTTTVALDQNYERLLTTTHSAQLPHIEANDTAWILFTSGSTGKPKGALLTHAGFMAGLRSAAIARPVQPTDRYLYPFPLFHVAAHNVLLQHLYGAAVVLTPAFEAATTLSACRELAVTTMSLAPTMIAMLLEHPDFRAEDLAGVRTIGYGASAMPLQLLQQLLRETSVGLCQSYGMTELCGSVAFLTVEDHREALDNPGLLKSVGRPLPTAEVTLVDDDGKPCAQREQGEIVVRASQCMAGYWQDPGATRDALRADGLHTGDIGCFDEQGYLYIVDRKKDMVLSGGENIASREVEEVVRGHPAVTDCAVIGLPDARWGELVCAVLVLQTEVSDDALATHCRALLAGYKTPRQWLRIDALPLNAAGKVDKPSLRRRFADKAAQSVQPPAQD